MVERARVHLRVVLTLVIAVPLGLTLSLVAGVFCGRQDRPQGWIEDAHPVFAKPSVEQAAFAHSPRVGVRPLPVNVQPRTPTDEVIAPRGRAA
jgi:hypothetical protein